MMSAVNLLAATENLKCVAYTCSTHVTDIFLADQSMEFMVLAFRLDLSLTMSLYVNYLFFHVSGN
jgi:hypothetical protein